MEKFTVEKKVTVTLTEDQIITLLLGVTYKADKDKEVYGSGEAVMGSTLAMRELLDEMLEAVRK